MCPPTPFRRSAARNPGWTLIPDEQWEVYRDAIAVARTTGLPFMLGGGFALAAYTGRWRNTKDIDFYVLPHQRQAFIDAITRAGFTDYYDQLAYDRGWIYRGFRDGTIVDLIWAMANRRTEAAEKWFKHATELTVRGEKLKSSLRKNCSGARCMSCSATTRIGRTFLICFTPSARAWIGPAFFAISATTRRSFARC